MKLQVITIRLLTIVFLLIGTVHLYGQNEYSINVKDQSLTEIISYLEQSYGINFAFNSDLNPSDTYSFTIKADNISDLLRPILSEAGLESQFINEQNILIRPKRLINNQQPTHRLILKDEKTKEPIEMVAVSILNSTIGSYTDENGVASFYLDRDQEYRAKISLLGYEEKTILLNSDNSQLSISLTRSALDIEEVIIADRPNIIATDPIVQKETIKMNDSGLQTSGVLGKDIMRQVQLVAGIAAHNDKSSGLQIRGGAEDQTLIVMDGIPIYNPSHYYGVFSSINASYVNNTSLFKNNLPIQFGGKTSGMLNLKSKDLSSLNETHGVVDLNLLTSSLVLQVPLNDDISFQINARTTYDNVSESGLANLFNDSESLMEEVQNFSLISREEIISALPDYKFSDWNAKMNIDINTNNQVDINFYKSNDAMANSYANKFKSRNRQGVVEISESYKNEENWTNLGGSLNWNALLSEKLTLSSTVYYTQFSNDALIDVSLFRQEGNQIIDFNRNNKVDNSISDYGIKSYVTYNHKPNHTMVVGVDIEKKDNQLNIAGQQLQGFEQDQTAGVYSGFASYQMLFDNGWSINTGLRSSFFSVSEKFYFSPRINLSKKLNTQWTFKASAARQNQFVKELSYENPQGRAQSLWVVGGTDYIPVSESNNFMLGATWIKDRFSIDIEGFYRVANGINEYAFINNQFNENNAQANFNDYQLYDGQSKNYGVDFLMSYTNKKYASWLAYTWSKGTNSFDEISRGEPFPSQEDRRHQLKWVNQYTLNNWSFNMNVIYSSGKPYTDLINFNPTSDRNNIRPEDRISRLPFYFRMDLGIDYRFKIKSQEASIGLSAFNLTDRDNVSYLQYIFAVPSNRNGQENTINTIIGTETNLLPRTINVNFSYKF